MTDDAELLRRYATDRSEEAFAELVRRHVDLVYSVALRQVGGDAHLAQDVAQTVFTALARKAGALSRRAVIGGWLYQTARFVACDAVRATRRRRAREQEANAMQENSPAPASEPDWEKLRPVLDEVIGELPEKDRDAVWLRYFDQQSFAAIGDRLQLTENAARMRVERALDKLHALLARRGVTSTTAALALALPGQLGGAAPAGLAVTLTQAALSGITGAAANATTGWALFQIMSSTKIVIGFATAVSVAALGTALYESRRSQAARADLAAAQQSSTTLQKRIQELESQLATQARESAAAQVQASAVTARASGVASASAVEEPITRETVSNRHNRARELARQGQFEAALAEYLWCYDVGMPQVPYFAGIRHGVTREIAAFAEQYPPAVAALRERRDDAERRLLASRDDSDAAVSLHSLNGSLKEGHRSLELHDRLPPEDPRRSTLGSLLFDEFTPAQRYQEAAVAKPYSSMSGHFEMMIGRETNASTPTLTAQQKQWERSFAIRTAAKYIEVLVGIDDLEHATDLAMRVLDHDSSPETRALLETHVARAGRPGLLDGLQPK